MGECLDPFAGSGERRVWAGQSVHQTPDAQAAEEVGGDELLQQRELVTAIGMQEVGDQTWGMPASVAMHPLYPDDESLASRVDPPGVGAPADHHTNLATTGTDFRDVEGTSWERGGFGIVLGGIGVMYDDQIGLSGATTEGFAPTFALAG